MPCHDFTVSFVIKAFLYQLSGGVDDQINRMILDLP
jgi:hypothetical protein